MSADADRTIREWLAMLARLSGHRDAAETAEQVRAYLPLLRAEFDARAFTLASLSHVARGSKFFPTYGELAALLSAWWRDNRPPAGPPIAFSAQGDADRARIDADVRVAEWNTEAIIGERLVRLERGPRDKWARMGARVLRRALETNAPAMAERFADRLASLSAIPDDERAARAPDDRPQSRHMHARQLLAEYERALPLVTRAEARPAILARIAQLRVELGAGDDLAALAAAEAGRG